MKSTFALLFILLGNSTFAAAADTADPCAKIENSTAEYDKTGAFSGCRVTAVTAGSAAEKAGVKVGQLVLPVGFQGKAK